MLGAGAAQLGLLAAARSRGLFVIAADRDPGAPGFRHADRRAIVSIEDEPALERLAEAQRIDGVIAPGGEAAVGAAARIAWRLGLSHPISPETAVLSTSKLRQRERLAEAGVPQTGWKVVSTADEVVGVPCVVRSPDRPGRGARALVRSSRELRRALSAALRASRIGLCLVEEVVEQPVVTVTGFSAGGVFHPLTVTDRLPSADVWESAHAEAAAALAERAAEVLQIAAGPTVTRVRIDPDGPKVLDVGAGLGAAHQAELCRAALGVDLDTLALSSALGERISGRRLRPRRLVGAACIRFFPGAEPVLATGTDRAEALERVECVPFPAADAQVV